MNPVGHDSLGACLLDERHQHRGAVDRRIGVRHRHDRAVAAGRGGCRPCRKRLLVLPARDPEMDMRVDERGRDDQPVGGARGRLERRDDPVAHHDIERSVDARGGIDDPSAANHERVGRRLAREQHHATSSASTTASGPAVIRS